MKKGICCAGNMIVDITYPIATWPKQGELTHITEGIQNSTGGAVCNTITDLARLDPQMHLVASGYAGHDAEGDFILQEMGKYPNIVLSQVRRNGRTSFTAVMSNNQTKERTFFQHAGANAYYGEDDINWDTLDVNIFHIGYILVLPALDSLDAEYGTKMARLLHNAQKRGFKTSIDVVTESGDRFAELVTPALKYSDYCIINELEAQQTTGICLRDESGIRVVWTNTFVSTSGMYGYGQYFNASCGGVGTGDVTICSSSTWSSSYTGTRTQKHIHAECLWQKARGILFGAWFLLKNFIIKK